MLKEYSIEWNGKTVGNAWIERQGMFWLIQCRCSVEMREPLRIVATSGRQKTDLGTCVSYRDGCGLQGRVSIKNICPDDLSFHIELVNSEIFIPVFEEKPFPVILELTTARFENRNGQAGVRIAIKD